MCINLEYVLTPALTKQVIPYLNTCVSVLMPLSFVLTVPSAPPRDVSANVSTVSPSIHVSWTPPPKDGRNGPLSDMYYVIQYSIIGNSVSTVTVRSGALRYTLINMTYCKEYLLRVAAANTNGTGPYSSNIIKSTTGLGEFCVYSVVYVVCGLSMSRVYCLCHMCSAYVVCTVFVTCVLSMSRVYCLCHVCTVYVVCVLSLLHAYCLCHVCAVYVVCTVYVVCVLSLSRVFCLCHMGHKQ